MQRIFQRHCSDESLISHLDGELSFYRRPFVHRHLAHCRRCRLRFSEIKAQMLQATRVIADDTFPGDGRITAARLAFLNHADGIAAEVFAKKRAARVITLPRLAWAASCLALLLAYALWKPAGRGTAPAVVEAIRRVDRAEAEAATRPTHQRFRVVARQIRPSTAERESRLEVWSEPERGQFTARLSDSRGILRHAVWQPEPGRQYVFRLGRGQSAEVLDRHEARERWETWLFRSGLTLEEFEDGLLNWLERRPWRPVSFTSGAALLADGDGAIMAMEQVGSTRRLRVRKMVDRVTVEFTLQLDSLTHAPALQSIRYENAERVLELVLYPERASAEPASFEPPASLIAKNPAPNLRLPGTEPEPAPIDDVLLEVQLHHTLHRLRACLGETIEVHRRADGAFEVRGALATAERKEHLTAALSPLAGPRLVVRLQSAEELLREIRPESVTPNRQALSRLPDRPRTLQFLARLFPGNPAAAEEFADRALSSGEAVMRDAQALRLLAEAFGGRSTLESGQARSLLDGMTHDHLEDLEASVEAAKRHLQPILAATDRATIAPAAVRWDLDLMRVFKDAETLNSRFRRLFAASAVDQNAVRLIAEIQESFPALESSVRAAAASR